MMRLFCSLPLLARFAMRFCIRLRRVRSTLARLFLQTREGFQAIKLIKLQLQPRTRACWNTKLCVLNSKKILYQFKRTRSRAVCCQASFRCSSTQKASQTERDYVVVSRFLYLSPVNNLPIFCNNSIDYVPSHQYLQLMQSYQLHIISDQLRKRHPYLEPPFKARYDPTEVYKAVFDRAIPKLIEILLTEGLTPDRYTNALITLNQIASDEAEKSNMIEQGCVGLASAFSHCKVNSIRREATLLLGLLLSTNEGLSKMGKETFTGLKNLLFDEELDVRNAVSWAICRIVLSRNGAEILCQEEITKSIVESFLKYSSLEQAKEEYFIIYLLVGFKHLLAYDSGIRFCLGTGLTARLKQLTSTKVYSPQGNDTIHQLSLGALSNIAMNPEGKNQCVREKVIESTHHFLESSEPVEVGNTVSLIMFTSINLLGKKQCIYNAEGKVDTTILVKLIKLLEKEDLGETTRNDVMESLKIISQENDGFLAVADYMSKTIDIKHIERIFGSTVIIPLAKLLPCVQEVPEPPTLPSNKINDFKAYAKTINYFLEKESVAVEIALKDCVDLATKLIMFMCYRGDKVLQQGIALSLLKLAEGHKYSAKILKDFIKQYGDVDHKISKTSVRSEIKRFENLAKELQVQ